MKILCGRKGLIILGYKSSFLDNATYGADDVSAIFSRLMSSGVLAYPENLTVAQSLDELNAQTVSSGVSEYGGLAVTKTETGVKLGEGAGFFESGICVEVDSDGVEIETISGAAVYVYFAYEKDFNRVELYAAEELPEGDVLMLAQVDAEGTVIDMRNYASAKIVPNTANVYHDFTVTNTMFSKHTIRDDTNTTYYEMPHNGFRYLLLHKVVTESVAILPYEHILDLTVEEEQSIRLNTSSTTTYMRVLKTGTTLRIASTRTTATHDTHTYYLTLV